MDTISLKEKKLFEIFLNALVTENTNSEIQFKKIYKKYNEKLRNKLDKLQLKDLLSNAAEKLSKSASRLAYELAYAGGMTLNNKIESLKNTIHNSKNLTKKYQKNYTAYCCFSRKQNLKL